MKLNLSCPATGAQKLIEIDDEKKLRAVYDHRIAQEIDGEGLGEEFKGYIFRISGGNDKEGFPMKQGVISQKRVRLLLTKDVSCYRPRKKGERKRKSVRGCIVAGDITVLNLVVVRIGEQPIAGLTDVSVDKRLGPKRASNIRKLFNLTKEDDVRKYVVKRTFTNKKGKSITKAPKIQRLMTPRILQRKRRAAAVAKTTQERHKKDQQEYQKVVQQRLKEEKERRQSEISKRKSRNSSKKQ